MCAEWEIMMENSYIQRICEVGWSWLCYGVQPTDSGGVVGSLAEGSGIQIHSESEGGYENQVL